MKTGRIIAIAAALCLPSGMWIPPVCSIVPAVTVSAAEEAFTEETLGDMTFRIYSDHAVLTAYNKEGNEEADIPAEVGGAPVTEIGSGAFRGCTRLRSVYALKPLTTEDDYTGHTITTIGESAFEGCCLLRYTNLFEESEEIGDRAFKGCTLLDCSYFSNRLKRIGKEAFMDCRSLSLVELSEGNRSIDDSAFENCIGLLTIYLPGSLEKIGRNAFSGCGQISFINYSGTEKDWEELTENIAPEGNEVLSDTGILYCDYREESTEVTDGKLTFEVFSDHAVLKNCDRKTAGELTVPAEVNGVPVTVIDGKAFDKCEFLDSVILPDGLKEIGSLAFKDSGVKDISIPGSVDKIEAAAFYETQWLKDMREKDPLVIVNGMVIDGQRCRGDVVIPEGVTKIEEAAFSGNKHITSVSIPESVTCIGNWAFDGCISLKSIVLPDSVRTFGTGVLKSCTALEEAVLPEGITRIEESMFHGCTSLRDVNIPDSVKIIGNMAFSGCSALKNVDIPDSVKIISDWAFSECEALTSVTIPGSVTIIRRYAFSSCTGLDSITIPESVVCIGESAFEGCCFKEFTLPPTVRSTGIALCRYCEKLESVSLPEGMMSVPELMFSGCKSLRSVTIPDGVKTIDRFAFSECESLEEIIMPDSVKTIGNKAFSGCGRMEWISLPADLTIAPNAFDGCDSLTDIYYAGTEEEWISHGFGNDTSGENNPLSSADKHYSSGPPSGADVASHWPGDVNVDWKITVSDAVAVLQYIANSEKYALTAAGRKNADCDGETGITGNDALTIQKYDAGVIDSFPRKYY